MPFMFHGLRRDLILLFLGAFFFWIFSPFSEFLTKNNFHSLRVASTNLISDSIYGPLPSIDPLEILETSIVSHAPGWTMFKDLYMENGTLFIVTSDFASLPEYRMMISKSLFIYEDKENIKSREPTSYELSAITPEDAQRRWGSLTPNGRNRIWTVEGNTLLFNDPPQFLGYYYQFVAELFFGAWAFYSGTFTSITLSSSLWSASTPIHPTFKQGTVPEITRAIFMHANANQWRDTSRLNAYFLRAAFPSLTVEVREDWDDRVLATQATKEGEHRAWKFPIAVLADRSASFRGVSCSSRTQRIASEAYEHMLTHGGVDEHGAWWAPVRKAVLEFAGVKPRNKRSNQIVVTYISRQAASERRLTDEDHKGLVLALGELVKKKSAEGYSIKLNVIKAEHLTKDEQVRVAARSTFLVGIHGNGLTSLVFMEPTPISAVIEIFTPEGFTHDYEWPSRTLGMRHFAVWNDTYHKSPHRYPVKYPPNFHSTSIPVHGPSVSKLIEEQIGMLR